MAWSRYLSSATMRVLVTDGQIWVLGLARTGDSHAALRRFRVDDGKPLGPPRLGLPPLVVSSTAARFFREGVLLRRRGDILFLPANPLQLWRFAPRGKFLDVKRPAGTGLGEVELQSVWYGQAQRRTAYDRIQNGATLPDDTVVVQIIAGLRPRADRSWLEVIAPDLQRAVARIPVTRPFGILLGSDREGYLFSSDRYIESATLVESRFDTLARSRPRLSMPVVGLVAAAAPGQTAWRGSAARPGGRLHVSADWPAGDRVRFGGRRPGARDAS